MGENAYEISLKKLHIDYTDNAIIKIGYDAFFEYTIKK